MTSDRHDTRPTILQIIPQLDTGGAELATLEITDAVVRAGGRMLVATQGGRLTPQIAGLGGEWIAFPAATKNLVAMIRNARHLAQIMAINGVDLIHARSRAPAWSALWAARLARRPFVTTYHGAYGGERGVKNFYNSVMARGDRVIANSHFTARLIERRHRVTSPRVVVVNRGVDMRKFDAGAIAPERLRVLREAWQMAPSARIILLAARLTDWKGQHVLIEAAGLLKARGVLENDHIVLAGDAQGRDDYVDRLRQQIDRHGLTKHVLLAGHCADIAAAFALAHVCVVASTKPEAFGRSAAEAQAMGCAVIATNLGAPAETVLAPPAVGRDQMTGWLVSPGDAAALATALEEALELAPAARVAMADRARRHIIQNYSLEQMQRQTLAVYDSILRTSGRVLIAEPLSGLSQP